MSLRTFSTAAEFLDAVGPTLYAGEAENSLPLGIALRLLDGHRYSDEAPFLACVEEAGSFPAIALRTPPYNLCLCAMDVDSDALGTIAGHLAQTGTALPGAHGRVDVVTAFATLWRGKTRAIPRVGMEQRLYRLDRVASPTGVPGHARWADEDDAGPLAAWAESFIDEAVPNDPKHDVRGMIERSIAAQGLRVWEDGEPVSMCARTRPTPHGASIGLVYTLPSLRGRGYASACVADLSQRILDSGKAFCTLFTDLANPTSNVIYQRIGYRPLCDFREIRFSDVTARAS
jgi:predicted GNAT family acetyltransferase